jgi:hypothetical protein
MDIIQANYCLTMRLPTLLVTAVQSPCPGNATLVNGTCTCDAGLLASYNGTTLISCTAGTTCPPSAPMAVRTGVPVTVGRITTDTPCPTGFTLAFYTGSPSVRIECRPNPGGCNVAPFSIQVQCNGTSKRRCLPTRISLYERLLHGLYIPPRPKGGLATARCA